VQPEVIGPPPSPSIDDSNSPLVRKKVSNLDLGKEEEPEEAKKSEKSLQQFPSDNVSEVVSRLVDEDNTD